MSGTSSNTFRISVNARVKDASGGQAYTFALQEGHGKSISNLLDDIVAKNLETSSMVLLGDFVDTFTELSANIESIVEISGGNTFSTNTLPSTGNVDVFVYAIDIYKNRALQKHPQSPVQLISDTITLNFAPELFIGAGVTEYAEHRNLDVDLPTFTINESLFDFDAPDGNQKLYVKNGNLDFSEFVVDSVKLVAFESAQTESAVVTYVNNDANAEKVFSLDLTQAVPGTITMPTFPVTFGQEYFLYSVIHDHGLNKDYVKLVKQDYAGQPPVIVSTTAKIVEV
jgi:hypothetical protein